MTNFPDPADSLEPQLEPVAGRLLDAQVAFAMQQLRGENYHSLVLDEIEHALLEASEITLAARSVDPKAARCARKTGLTCVCVTCAPT